MPPEVERGQIHEAIRLHTLATGERPLGWYTGRCSLNTVDLVSRGRRLRLRLRHLRRRPALLAAAQGARPAHHPLLARDQRHAVRHGIGLRQWRGVFPDAQGHASTALWAEGAAGKPEDDVARAALPAGRHAGAVRGAARNSSTTSRARTRSGSPSASTSRGTGRATHPYRGAGAGPVADGRGRSSSTASARSSSTRRGSRRAPGRASSGRSTTPPPACTSRSARSSAARPTRSGMDVLRAHPDLAGKLAAAKRLTDGVDRRAGLGRARRADRRRARAVHAPQRGLHAEVRLPLHHRGQGQHQGVDPRGVRDAARQFRDHRVPDRLRAGRADRVPAAEGDAAGLDKRRASE